MTKSQKDRLFFLYFIEANYNNLPKNNIGKFIKTDNYNEHYCLWLLTNYSGPMPQKNTTLLNKCGLMVHNNIKEIKIIKLTKYARSGNFKHAMTIDKLVSSIDILGHRQYFKVYNYSMNYLGRHN